MALLSNSELCLLYNEAAAAVVCGDSEPAVRFSEAVVAEMRSARDGVQTAQ